MKIIKTNTVLTNFKGEPLKDGTKDLTIGNAISFVLGGKVSNPTLGWNLGKKFATDKEVELKAEDIVFIKKEIIENATQKEGGWMSIVAGQIVEILEGTEESKEKKK